MSNKLRGNSLDDKVRYARPDLHGETEHHAKHIVDDGPDEDGQILCSLSRSSVTVFHPQLKPVTYGFKTQLLSDIDNQQSRQKQPDAGLGNVLCRLLSQKIELSRDNTIEDG